MCTLGNLAPGQEVTIQVAAETLKGDLGRYQLSVWTVADNAGRVQDTGAIISASVTVLSSGSSEGGGSADIFLTLGLILLVGCAARTKKRGRTPFDAKGARPRQSIEINL